MDTVFSIACWNFSDIREATVSNNGIRLFQSAMDKAQQERYQTVGKIKDEMVKCAGLKPMSYDHM